MYPYTGSLIGHGRPVCNGRILPHVLQGKTECHVLLFIYAFCKSAFVFGESALSASTEIVVSTPQCATPRIDGKTPVNAHLSVQSQELPSHATTDP